MAAEQNGLLADSLRRLGISLSLDSRGSSDNTDSLASDAAGEQILCSRNVNDILSRAQSEVAGEARKVEERDLLRAFVQNGGGAAGTLLLHNGIPPRMLTSRLFLDGGVLDSGRFDEAGQKVLDETLDFAKQRGYLTVGSRHLLYGLLSASAYFAQELRRQGRDAELLAEALYASVSPGNQGSTSEIPRWSSLSTGLLKVLCDAEALSDSESSATICDMHLSRAWCLDGGGASRQFLIQQGVRVRKLCK
jgi:ATP-dependent Clp protease ATP-binding subunit ClpA